jgi:hypothetical protein
VVQVDNTKPAWHVRATNVREYNGSLRWSLEAWQGNEVVAVTADSSTGGRSIDVQSETYMDSTLDAAVRWHVADTIAQHEVLQQLDAIHGKRYGRSDRLRVA